MFRFKQFYVDDSLCGMKVGTDGVLLGAWAPLTCSNLPSANCTILDIGTGSGLIALMLAQRCLHADITAIDISEECIQQAEQNFAASPWSERLHAVCCPLSTFNFQLSTSNFHLIVSNPPYFINSLPNPDPQRRTARHDDSLTLADIMLFAQQHLTPQGILALVLPADLEEKVIAVATEHQLVLSRLTRVVTRAGKTPKRILAAFRLSTTENKQSSPTTIDELCLQDSDAPRSKAYMLLTKDFYL